MNSLTSSTAYTTTAAPSGQAATTPTNGANTANSSIRPGIDFTSQGTVTTSKTGQVVPAPASGTFSNQTSGSSVTNARLVQSAGNFINNGPFNVAGSAPTGYVKVAGGRNNPAYVLRLHTATGKTQVQRLLKQ